MSKNFNKHMIGLLINNSSILAVEMDNSHENKVIKYAERGFPENLIKDGMFANLDTACEFFKNFFKDYEFSHSPITIGIKNKNILLRMANFPIVPDDKVKNAVLLQSQQFIPVPISELVLDFVRYDDTSVNGKDMMSILLVGVRKNYISELLTVFQNIGYQVNDIDSAMLAGIRAITDQKVENDDKVKIILDVDDDSSNITFLKNDSVLMTRTVLIPAFTDEVLEYAGEVEEEITTDEKIFNHVVTNIETGVRNSLMYFNNTNKDETVDKVYLYGQMNNLHDVADYISNRLSIGVVLPEIYKNINIDDTDLISKYAACIALTIPTKEEVKKW